MGLNKGEYSELYAIFYLLANNKLKIVDHKLNLITEDLFVVQEIMSNSPEGVIRFEIVKDAITPYIADKVIDLIGVNEIREFGTTIFDGINESIAGKGSFDLDEVDKWLIDKQIESKFKANSRSKKDITLLNIDTNKNKSVELGYSVKSQLGSPATLLNPSSHTKFKYIVEGLSKENVKKVNDIKTRNKLIDKLKAIRKYGGKIRYHSVISETFENNLKLIDSLLPEALGEVLLKSFELSEKKLIKLFNISEVYKNDVMAQKKLKDFLTACSLGMFPSVPWDGYFTADGGILIVSTDKNVYILDLVYYKKELEKYLLYNSKIDKPSSTRYDMLNLVENDGEVSFTLTLQVRFIK